MAHIQDGECNLISLLESFDHIYKTCGFSGDVTELFNFRYRPINLEGELEDGFRTLFKHQHRDLTIEHTTSSLPITELERSYELYLCRNLYQADPNSREIAEKCRIYRQSPIDWSKLPFLGLRMPIRPGNVQMVYEEHNELGELTLDNLLEGNYYSMVLDKNTKFALVNRVVEHQAEIIGYFTGPTTSPLVPKSDNFDHTWMRNWSWIDELNCSSEELVVSLNQQSYGHFKNILKFFQKCLDKFKNRVRLGNVVYWLDEAREPRQFVEYLQIYAKTQTMLYMFAFNALQKTWLKLVECEKDLAVLTTMVLKK